jgi:hypothetical protein
MSVAILGESLRVPAKITPTEIANKVFRVGDPHEVASGDAGNRRCNRGLTRRV